MEQDTENEIDAEPPRLTFSLRAHRMGMRDFRRAYGTGSRARGGQMTVAVCDNGLEITRLGLSVGKRCWKSAVKRNRVRRVFREAFRLSLPELPPGLDVVMIGSTPLLEPGLAEVQRELIAMTLKAHRRYRAKLDEEQA